MAGFRLYDDGLPYNRGSRGYYRSSSPDFSYAYLLDFDASLVGLQGGYGRADGLSVRCVKNTPPPDTEAPVITLS
jgi:hypothetical protein